MNGSNSLTKVHNGNTAKEKHVEVTPLRAEIPLKEICVQSKDAYLNH